MTKYTKCSNPTCEKLIRFNRARKVDNKLYCEQCYYAIAEALARTQHDIQRHARNRATVPRRNGLSSSMVEEMMRASSGQIAVHPYPVAPSSSWLTSPCTYDEPEQDIQI